MKLYREEKIKVTPNDPLEIDGIKRTALSWSGYDVFKLQGFLRANREYSPSVSLQQIIKKQINAANATGKDSK
jgi:hypothetical protein